MRTSSEKKSLWGENLPGINYVTANGTDSWEKSVNLQQNATGLQLWDSLQGLELHRWFFSGESGGCDKFWFAFLITFSDFFKSEMMQDKMGGQNSSFQLC